MQIISAIFVSYFSSSWSVPLDIKEPPLIWKLVAGALKEVASPFSREIPTNVCDAFCALEPSVKKGAAAAACGGALLTKTWTEFICPVSMVSSLIDEQLCSKICSTGQKTIRVIPEAAFDLTGVFVDPVTLAAAAALAYWLNGQQAVLFAKQNYCNKAGPKPQIEYIEYEEEITAFQRPTGLTKDEKKKYKAKFTETEAIKILGQQTPNPPNGGGGMPPVNPPPFTPALPNGPKIYILASENYGGTRKYSVTCDGKMKVIRNYNIPHARRPDATCTVTGPGGAYQVTQQLLYNHGPSNDILNQPPMRRKSQKWDRAYLPDSWNPISINYKNHHIAQRNNPNSRFCSLEDLWTALHTRQVLTVAGQQPLWASAAAVYTRTAPPVQPQLQPLPVTLATYSAALINSIYGDNCECPISLGNVRNVDIVIHAVPCRDPAISNECVCIPCTDPRVL